MCLPLSMSALEFVRHHKGNLEFYAVMPSTDLRPVFFWRIFSKKIHYVIYFNLKLIKLTSSIINWKENGQTIIIKTKSIIINTFKRCKFF